MCLGHYMFYSRCSHCDFGLIDFCDKAHEAAWPGARHPGDAEEVRLPPQPNTEAEASPNTSRGKRRQAKGQERHDAPTSVVRGRTERPQQTAHATQPVPRATWASVVRTAVRAGPEVAHARVTQPTAFMSPAKRLAARLEAGKPTDEGDAPATQSSEPEQWSIRDPARSRWVGRGTYRGGARARRSSTLSSATAHGRSGSDQTVRLAKPTAAERAQLRLLALQEPSIDPDSPAEFPTLSPQSPPPPPPSAHPEASSWAHIARLVSADRPYSSSTSDLAAASDAGTVSTSPSSFDSDTLDLISLATPAIPGMAPARTSGATISFRRPPPPANAAPITQPGSPRRHLPVEWTGGLHLGSEDTTRAVTRPKSLRNLRKQPKAAHDVSAVIPKSPTKAQPFDLATSRRAEAREQKKKASGATKIIPVVPKTLAASKTGLKSHSKAGSSDSTSTSQYQTAAASPFPSSSSQSFATAHDEPYHTLAPLGSPSRIPRLVVPLGRGAARASGSEPSPVRLEPRHDAPEPETASEPPADIRRTPSPAAPPIQRITAQHRFSGNAKTEGEGRGITVSEKDYAKPAAIGLARSEMTKSDDAIGKASSTVADLPHTEYSSSHVHFVETPGYSQNNPNLRTVHDAPALTPRTNHPQVLSHARPHHTSETQRPCQAAGTMVDITSGRFSGAEVAGSVSSCTETSKRDESPQWSLRSAQSGDSSDVSTVKGSTVTSPGDSFQTTTPKRTSVLPHKRTGWGKGSMTSSPFEGHATMPGRLNAEAQEFVPGGPQGGSPVIATGTRTMHSRSHVPPEWAITQAPLHVSGQPFANQYAISQPTGSSSSSGKKRSKTVNRSRGLSEEQDEPWSSPVSGEASVHNQAPAWPLTGGTGSTMGTYGTGPGHFSAPMGQYGMPGGPAGGDWVPDADAGHMGSAGAFRTMTNTQYGPMMQMTKQPPRAPYPGRGGVGLPSEAIAKGDDAVEKWWHGGWTSTNGGPLTHGSVYDYLRLTEQARSKYRSIFRPEREGSAREYGGYGMPKPCGDMVVQKAFEALPHYPLLCPKCQPDSHESV